MKYNGCPKCNGCPKPDFSENWMLVSLVFRHFSVSEIRTLPGVQKLDTRLERFVYDNFWLY